MEMDIRKVVERKFYELEIKTNRTEEENKELARLANLQDKFDHIDYVKSLQIKFKKEEDRKMGVDKTVRYIGNTFSPAMLKAGEGCVAVVEEIDITAIPRAILAECKSVVSHEVTAKILSAITGTEVSFNRVNIALTRGDVMYCIVPNFRANEAREFTEDEVRSSGFRAFFVAVESAENIHYNDND